MFAGGEGTESDPFRIASADHIQNMNLNLSAHYVLVGDVDASDTRSWNGNAGFDPIGSDSNKFTGSLDGQGYEITGLYINRSSQFYVGLFGYVSSSYRIENISIINCNVTGSSIVGGLVGYDEDSTITKCYATGKVNGTNIVGGLVGYNDGNLTQCYATGNVNGSYNVGGLVGANYGNLTQCYATGNVTGSGNVGGLVGNNGDCTITQCYATGIVNGSGDYVGSLVGCSFQGTLTQCYATGNVTGSSNGVGGLVGYSFQGTITQCYWDKETTGQTTSSGSDPSYGKETGEMNTESTFVGWDFDNVWTFCNEATAS